MKPLHEVDHDLTPPSRQFPTEQRRGSVSQKQWREPPPPLSLGGRDCCDSVAHLARGVRSVSRPLRTAEQTQAAAEIAGGGNGVHLQQMGRRLPTVSYQRPLGRLRGDEGLRRHRRPAEAAPAAQHAINPPNGSRSHKQPA